MADEFPIQRVRNACEACHERKIKCKASPAGGACQTCAATGRHCFFLPRIKAGRPRRKRTPPPENSTEITVASPAVSSNDGSQAFEDACMSNDSTETIAARWPLLRNPGFDFTFESQSTPMTAGLTNDSEDIDTLFSPLDVPGLISDSSATSPGSVQSPPLTSPFDAIDPSYLQTNIGAFDPGTGLAAPAFREVINKLSESQRLLETLQSPAFSNLTFDTSAPSNALQRILQTLDAAGDVILRVANAVVADSDSQLNHSPILMDNVDPAVLTKSPVRLTKMTVTPAMVMVTFALSMQILDICDFLTTSQPCEPATYHRMLFLKRVDINIIQVRSALAQMHRSGQLSLEAMSKRSMDRAGQMQARTKASMDSAQSFCFY